jgi:hypothetical protein
MWLLMHVVAPVVMLPCHEALLSTLTDAPQLWYQIGGVTDGRCETGPMFMCLEMTHHKMIHHKMTHRMHVARHQASVTIPQHSLAHSATYCVSCCQRVGVFASAGPVITQTSSRPSQTAC